MKSYDDFTADEVSEVIGPVYDRDDIDGEVGQALDVRALCEQRVILQIATPAYEFLVPAFCLDDDGRPVVGLPETLHRLDPRDLHDERAAVWLASPNELLDGRTPIQALTTRDLDLVLTAAAAQQFTPPPLASDTRAIAPLPRRDERRSLVEQVGSVVETGRMAQFLRWPQAKLAELLERRLLLAFPGQYGLSSPGSMWDERNRGLPRLREASFALDSSNADPIGVAIWLHTPHYALNGQRPSDVLKGTRAQDAVTLAYRTSAATRQLSQELNTRRSDRD